MSDFITAEVPTVQMPDGRLVITDEAVMDEPWIMEFIGRFSNYWERDERIQGWISPLPGGRKESA